MSLERGVVLSKNELEQRITIRRTLSFFDAVAVKCFVVYTTNLWIAYNRIWHSLGFNLLGNLCYVSC
ncbi:hypothetical protein CICLE_v10030324mg [Citrus x clementina]|uniref:Uncharacterized protein n=1 Tax=Citrus clementina TaxID=85681 RepID=V4S6E2_CITCL|nr:hypothetical protein CICLE_v10030324mg [Citrus x clementina]